LETETHKLRAAVTLKEKKGRKKKKEEEGKPFSSKNTF